MARILRIDPIIMLAETDDRKRAARYAAAQVYQDDDQRNADKQKASMDKMKGGSSG